MEDLRASGLSVINSLLIGNGRLSEKLVKDLFLFISQLLMKEVLILPDVLRLNNPGLAECHSENLSSESLELLLNLITIKEVYPLFVQ